jgi:1-acyl-sn-glycerol-3-phosphate acyltransferase
MAFLIVVLFVLNTVVHAVVAFNVVLLAKFLVPIPAWRRLCDRGMVAVSFQWTLWNTRIFSALGGLRLVTDLAPGIELAPTKRYLIISNHQSWTDIFAMQGIFHPRTPFLTFFLKRQLLYVPVFGVIWWALGFPYMKRFSSAYLAKHPEMKNKDLETTRRFCQRIRGKPYAIINFVEGTRRTPAKAAKSPYRHLLPPKAGGVATALQALDYEFDHVLDVTLTYRGTRTSFSDLLAGRVGEVHAAIREIPLGEIPKGDYFTDPAYAEAFRAWLNGVWKRKDEQIEAEVSAAGTTARAG